MEQKDKSVYNKKKYRKVQGGGNVISTYTAKYTKINSGYMGQLVEWPEVITEGKTLEECREMIQDALHEMIIAYRQQNKEIPVEEVLFEHISVVKF